MQLKYSFKKEWSHFSRTFKLMGILITMFAFLLIMPLFFNFTAVMLKTVMTPAAMEISQVSFGGSPSVGDAFNEIDMEDIITVYSDGGLMYYVTVSGAIPLASLIIMIILRDCAGGEQKKRAMIVPLCSGLDKKSYLLAKFILYPLSCFMATFLSAASCGALCAAIFPENKPSFGIIILGAAASAFYMLFLMTVYLSVGLCTSHPGVTAAIIYASTSIVQTILSSAGLRQFHPLALMDIIAFSVMPDFKFSDQAANFFISTGITIVVCVVMFFLAWGVLRAKTINNREKIEPEF